MSAGTIEVYQRRNRLGLKRKQWDWRLIAANGNILCGSDQGYSSRAGAGIMALAVVRGDYSEATLKIEQGQM